MKEKIPQEKLKDKIKTYIEQYENKKITFMTYELDTAFFEMQLLPYFFYKWYLRRANPMLVATELEKSWEGNTSISVYYDNLINDKQNVVKYESFKVNTDEGVFHSKMIIINGKKKGLKGEYITVIVLSANLTTSSYGSNQEIVGIVEQKVNEKNKELVRILNKEPSKENLNKIIKLLNENFADLIITDKTKNQIEQVLLEDTKKLTIVSPFISAELLEEYSEKINVELIFTNLRGLKKEDKPKLKNIIKTNSNCKFFFYEGERKIHSKLYIVEKNNGNKFMLIGSHNFTTSALKEKNIEASIIINDKDLIRKTEKYCQLIKVSKNIEELEQEIDKAKNLENKEKNNVIIKQSKVFWDEGKVIIELEGSYKKVEIIQLGNQVMQEKMLKTEAGFEYELKQYLNLVFKNKFFKIKVDDKYITEGLFNEVGTIDKEKAINNENYFYLLEYELTNRIATEREYMEFVDEDFETQETKKDEEIKKYDIVRMFLAYKKINDEIDENKNDEKWLEKRYKLSPDSIVIMRDAFLKILEEEIKDNEQLVYLLLTCNELILLFKKYNKKVDNKSLEKHFQALKEQVIKEMKKLDNYKNMEANQVEQVLEIYLKSLK